MKTTQYKNQNIHEHNTPNGKRWTATYVSEFKTYGNTRLMERMDCKSRYAAKKQINRWNLIHGEVTKR